MSKFNLFDKMIIWYCLLTTLAILFLGRPFSEYIGEIIFYISMAGITVLIVYFFDENKNKINRIIRLVYPVVMFTFFYTATGGLMFLLFDKFYDFQLTAFEKAIFGVNPTLYIDQHLLNVWLNEIISMCYFLYYFMIPGFVIFLLVKKNYDVLKSFMNATCLTFFTSYWLFFLYPIEGPRYHFVNLFQNSIEGPVFRQLVEMVIANGAVRGGCMPSSHFGVALVILLYCYKYYKKVAYGLTPIVFGLAIGTFWGRFHYVSDVFVGGAIGLIAVIIIWHYDNRNGKIVYKEKVKEEISI